MTASEPNWRWLRDTYGLSERELDAVLLTLAPELDPHYSRLYGVLAADARTTWPSVNLVLDLLTYDGVDKLQARAMFRAESALIAGRVLHLVRAPDPADPPLLSHRLRLDPQIVDVLCQHTGLDDRLTTWCSLNRPAATGVPPLTLTARAWLPLVQAARAVDARRSLRLCFWGPVGSGRRETVTALAAELDRPLLAADLSRVPTAELPWADALAVLLREADLHGALLYLEGAEDVRRDGSVNDRATIDTLLAGHDGVLVVATRHPWRPSDVTPLGVVDVSFASPSFELRRISWSRSLTDHALALPAEEVDELAERFLFGRGPIADAVATAASTALVQGRPGRVTSGDLFAAARHQTSHRLTGLARRIPLTRGFQDLVLPDEALTQLREICERVSLRRTVWQQWGFDTPGAGGQGTTALFTGPPGTGKTLAAQVIASELGIDLFAIDLSTVVSKYIGETEKNLDAVFSAATDSNAVLFFDEADALFAKRTQIHDAHDRYANIETSFLLQRMEAYDGVAILATNLRDNFDEAFTRRLAHIVEFDLPDEERRQRLWEISLPASAPLDPELDPAELASRYHLSGASIRNIAVNAAFLAAAHGRPIGPDHIRLAVRRDYAKMGKVLADPGSGVTHV